MPRVLITGANRGLGLEFARQYAADNWQVIATCRHPEAASDLKLIAGNITILPFDAADDGSLVNLLTRLAGVPLDVVIPNAGVGSGGTRLASQVTREQWMEQIA